MVDLLMQSLHPYTQSDGKLCFSFKVHWDGIYDDLAAAQADAEIPFN